MRYRRVCHMDEQNRIEIPDEITNVYGWDATTELEIRRRDDLIGKAFTVRETTSRCDMCGRNVKHLVSAGVRFICITCMAMFQG